MLDKTVRKEVLRRQFNVSASISSLKTMLVSCMCVRACVRLITWTHEVKCCEPL